MGVRVENLGLRVEGLFFLRVSFGVRGSGFGVEQ